LYADLVVIAETEDDLTKRLNEDNMENRSMGVIMNKTKVMISGEWQKVTQKAGHVMSVVEVLVVIQYSILVISRGYTRSIVV